MVMGVCWRAQAISGLARSGSAMERLRRIGDGPAVIWWTTAAMVVVVLVHLTSWPMVGINLVWSRVTCWVRV